MHMNYTESSANNSPMNISTTSAPTAPSQSQNQTPTPSTWNQVHSPKPSTTSLLLQPPLPMPVPSATTHYNSGNNHVGRNTMDYSDTSSHDASGGTSNMSDGEYQLWVMLLNCQASPEDIIPHCKPHGTLCGHTVSEVGSTRAVFIRYLYVCIYLHIIVCIYV